MIRKSIALLFSGFLLISSCTKYEVKTIEGNTPPPDNTIPSSLQVGFINKAYISILGREPDTDEYNSAKSVLDQAEFSESSRKEVVNQILTNDEFYDREFEIYRNDLLNSTDTIQITDLINTFEFLLTSPAYEAQWPLIEVELTRLQALRDVPTGLKNGTVSLKEMQRRCIDNNFFDQINMGSLNFVLAVFQHLLLRNPTEFELSEGVKIVDGFNGILFLQIAQSKIEFENIFFNSDAYYEGQVKLNFYRFLLRMPNSEETAYYTNMLKANSDYKSFLAEILSGDEYAGLTN